MFVHKDIGVLTSLVMGIIPMLKPFVWQNPLIPILPLSMKEVLQAPVPFIVGLTDLSLYLAHNKTTLDSNISLFVVDENKPEPTFSFFSKSLHQFPENSSHFKEFKTALTLTLSDLKSGKFDDSSSSSSSSHGNTSPRNSSHSSSQNSNPSFVPTHSHSRSIFSRPNSSSVFGFIKSKKENSSATNLHALSQDSSSSLHNENNQTLETPKDQNSNNDNTASNNQNNHENGNNKNNKNNKDNKN